MFFVFVINYIDKNIKRTSTVRVREPRDFHVRGTEQRFKKVAADFVCDNGIIEVSLLYV